ncbi:hypothetical protein RJT34_26538 [Clitoria ternatea]|uniref:Uncharacterized protein n=1 Tax=Clitoria ternatea TaxID=43366 RepID=A0AAN9F914_CLITE
MVQKWDGVPFQQASARNRANRATDAAASVYTGGSISTLEHKKRFEAYQARRAEKEADLVASTPEGEVPPTLSCSDDNAIYMEAVGGVNKKGRVFGLGGVGTQLAKKGKTPSSSSSSSSALPTEVVQRHNLNRRCGLPGSSCLRLLSYSFNPDKNFYNLPLQTWLINSHVLRHVQQREMVSSLLTKGVL